MALILCDDDVVIDFTPTFKGNDKSTEPLSVSFTPVGNKKVSEYSKRISTRSEDSRTKTDYMKVSRQVAREQFCENVKSLKNCKLKSSDKILTVTDPGVFFDKAPTSLVNEIIAEMESAAELTDTQEKNLEGDFAGTS